MRIYAVADIHGKPRHIETLFSVIDQYRPDIMVAAGDLTGLFNWHTCLNQLDSLSVPVLAIRGNSDLRRVSRKIDQALNITGLTQKPYRVQDFDFMGTDGTLVLPFASKICLGETARLALFPPMGPESVLVVHPPPKGTLDRVAGRFNAGSRALDRFIRAAAPGLVLCGHIHEQPGQAMLGSSMVVNCSMGKKSCGVIIDLQKGQLPGVNLLQP